jgi:CheY-like chemotaxis protein
MNRPKVLIVDDVEENLILLAFALKAFDVDVVKAHDGFEAETLCTEHEFLLIILDVHMPGRTGIEAAGVIRAETRNGMTPIIFLTADTTASEIPRSAYSIGAVDVMFKPLEAARLRAKVQVFLDLYLARMKVEGLMERLEASQAQLIAQEKYQAVSSLIGSMSHNFNNQLCIAEGYATALLEDADAATSGPLVKIVAAVGACTELLEKMQSFTGVNQVTSSELAAADRLILDFVKALDVVTPEGTELSTDIGVGVNELELAPQVLRKIFLSIAQFLAEQIGSRAALAAVDVFGLAADGALLVNIRCRGVTIEPTVQAAVMDFFSSNDVVAQQQSIGLAAAKTMTQDLDGLLTLEAAPDSFEVHLRIPLAALKSELNLG